jgi:hypothetical protein
MESGKTTTVAGLVRAGYGYLTDEAAAVCLDDLHVEPFHKSLSIDAGSWGVLESLRPLDAGAGPTQWQVPVSSIPGARLADRTPLAWFVLPRYVAGSVTRLERVTRAAAVMSLAASTFGFLDEPQRSLDGLAHLVRNADCYQLTVGSLDEAIAQLTRLTEAA